MAYVMPNVRTKKELRERVKNGERITVFSPGPFGATYNGTESVEGPHYPEAHTWYASVEVTDGVVTKVRG